MIESASKYFATAGGLLALLTLCYVLWRTRSGHLLRLWLFRALFRKNVPINSEVQKFIEDRTSLMTFRYLSGVNARSLQSAKRLTDWLKTQDEDIDNIRATGSYFDFESLQMKPHVPGKGTMGFYFSSLCLVWMCFVFVSPYTGSDQGIFYVKESDQWFTINVGHAAPFMDPFSDYVELTPERCKKKEFSRSGFSEKDAQAICNAFEDEKFMNKLPQVIANQRVTAAFFAFVLVAVLALIIRAMHHLSSAWKLAKRLGSQGT